MIVHELAVVQAGRIKPIFLIPAVLFAVVIASRRVHVASQTPSPASPNVLTIKVVVVALKVTELSVLVDATL